MIMMRTSASDLRGIIMLGAFQMTYVGYSDISRWCGGSDLEFTRYKHTRTPERPTAPFLCPYCGHLLSRLIHRHAPSGLAQYYDGIQLPIRATSDDQLHRALFCPLRLAAVVRQWSVIASFYSKVPIPMMALYRQFIFTTSSC